MGEMANLRRQRLRNGISICLVCDFGLGLCLRIIDVYKLFNSVPRITVIRRGSSVPADPQVSVCTETIPLPVVTQESPRFADQTAAVLCTIGYVACALLILGRILYRRRLFNLVHAHFVLPQGLVGLIFARVLRVPFFITATGTDVNSMMKTNAVQRLISLRILKLADGVIAVNRSLLRQLTRLGVSGVVYLPNSVNVESIPPVSTTARRVLFVGAMNQNKRPLFLIQAFQKVLEKNPGASLFMCGDGPLSKNVAREIRERHLQGKITLIPFLAPIRLNVLRASCGIFVLPSLREGMSLSILEGLAAGQVVIATNNLSNSSFLKDGKTALLFEENDLDGLAIRIELALSDRRLRSRLCRAGRKLVSDNFANKTVAKELEELYLQVLAQHISGK